jgi:hypothetical protein
MTKADNKPPAKSRTISDRERQPIQITFVGKNPDGSFEVEANITNEAMADIQAIVSGKKKGVFQPVMTVNLLGRARLGDCEPLIHHFESGGDITEEERRAIGALARGNWPSSANRPPQAKTELRNRDIARFAAVLKFYGGKRVPDVAAKKFKVDRSHVIKLTKQFGTHELTGAYCTRALFAALGADQATARKLMLGYAGVTEDNIREATARKPKGKMVK